MLFFCCCLLFVRFFFPSFLVILTKGVHTCFLSCPIRAIFSQFRSTVRFRLLSLPSVAISPRMCACVCVCVWEKGRGKCPKRAPLCGVSHVELREMCPEVLFPAHTHASLLNWKKCLARNRARNTTRKWGKKKESTEVVQFLISEAECRRECFTKAVMAPLRAA